MPHFMINNHRNHHHGLMPSHSGNDQHHAHNHFHGQKGGFSFAGVKDMWNKTPDSIKSALVAGGLSLGTYGVKKLYDKFKAKENTVMEKTDPALRGIYDTLKADLKREAINALPAEYRGVAQGFDRMLDNHNRQSDSSVFQSMKEPVRDIRDLAEYDSVYMPENRVAKMALEADIPQIVAQTHYRQHQIFG